MGDMNQEPSMEEILASIKRVIAEDTPPPPVGMRPNRDRAPDPLDSLPDEDDEDVLELHDPMLEDSGLLSEGTAQASRQSLAALAAMSHPAAEPAAPVSDGALEAVVRDMLRPMLKQWLDQRLPEMVEEMVSREIARITGKRL